MTDDEIATTIGAAALTEYADPRHHPIRIESYTDAGGDYQAIAVCGCGWTSIPVPWASLLSREVCPVLEALQERAERIRR